MSANTIKIETKIADCAQEWRDAARLRYDVFVRELSGSGSYVDHRLGEERDAFDAHADHLIAVDRGAGDKVIGVYRLLTADAAKAAGRFYSEDEYDLSKLRSSGRNLLELGRSCVHPDYRGSTAMFDLWQGLATYVLRHKIDVLFGMASFHGTDPAKYAHALSHLAANYAAPTELSTRSTQYQSMQMIDANQIDRLAAIKDTPALIKSYLRLGGVVGDGAFVDHDFNTIDVCLIMDTAKLSDRSRAIYAKERAQ